MYALGRDRDDQSSGAVQLRATAEACEQHRPDYSWYGDGSAGEPGSCLASNGAVDQLDGDLAPPLQRLPPRDVGLRDGIAGLQCRERREGKAAR